MKKMSSRLARESGLVVVAGVLVVLAGCTGGPERDVLLYGPEVETLTAPGEYASRSIEASGGLGSWIRSERLDLDCVVTVYRSDGSRYLTEQRYEIYPWSNAIRVSGLESEGRYVWQVSPAGMEALEGEAVTGPMSDLIGRTELAGALIQVTTAPIRFFDAAARFNKLAAPLKIGGQWYDVIERTDVAGSGDGPAVEPHGSRAVLYQNRDTSVVDTARLSERLGQKSLWVRGYDYRRLDKDSVSVPARIEIFMADALGGLGKRLVRIDLK